MKKVISISYWLLAVVLVALVVISIGYGVGESFFIGTLFLPGALAAKFAYVKIRKAPKKERVRSIVYVSIGILIGEIFLCVVAHYAISAMRSGLENYYKWPNLPSLLANPVFIAFIIVALSAGSVLLDNYLSKKYPSGPKTITFLSERHSVTLELGKILYVESNDAITILYADDGQSYRNKTPISAWESILGDDFVRIHRSYLVQRAAITSIERDFIYIGDVELPISRKYKNSVII